MKDLAQLQQKVKAAWAKLPPDLKLRLEPQILAAHQFALAVRSLAFVPSATPPPHQLLMVYSLLHDDPDGLLQSATAPAAEGVLTRVGGDGEIYFGGVQYDSTDPGWAYILIAMAETLDDTPAFKLPQKAVEIAEDATLAILGDWGGGNGPAQSVAQAALASKAQYFIHLGDVYYAGTNAGFLSEPYQQKHFLDVWPGPAGASFTLNSNHDMYAHATGYARALGPGTAFGAQMGANAFALYNSSFRVVGLDSAYYAPDELFDVGSLGSASGPQAKFLQQQAQAAAAAKQDLILLTHHNGLSADGSSPEPLWQEVADQLAAFEGKSVCWYWGHAHLGVVYRPQTVNGVTLYGRCCGHGCQPWGVASALKGKSNVVWFEQEVLQPGPNYFVTNGYATLALSGGAMTETFYDQSGHASWSDTWPAAAQAA